MGTITAILTVTKSKIKSGNWKLIFMIWQFNPARFYQGLTVNGTRAFQYMTANIYAITRMWEAVFCLVFCLSWAHISFTKQLCGNSIITCSWIMSDNSFTMSLKLVFRPSWYSNWSSLIKRSFMSRAMLQAWTKRLQTSRENICQTDNYWQVQI